MLDFGKYLSTEMISLENLCASTTHAFPWTMIHRASALIKINLQPLDVIYALILILRSMGLLCVCCSVVAYSCLNYRTSAYVLSKGGIVLISRTELLKVGIPKMSINSGIELPHSLNCPVGHSELTTNSLSPNFQTVWRYWHCASEMWIWSTLCSVTCCEITIAW